MTLLKASTVPDVFIIESLNFDDEEHHREGEVIYRTLKMSGKNPIYHYVRTRTELEYFVQQFGRSRYRYLHISCHGNINTFATTFDKLNDDEMSNILGQALNGKRLFLSTCLAATSTFSQLLFDKGTCLSIAGPAGEIKFDDSAIFWTSFYHLMFKANSVAMKHQVIKDNLSTAGRMLSENLVLFYAGKSRKAITLQLPHP